MKLSTHKGFTLIEMIIVITITGILAGMVAVFIMPPINAYFASVRRAELTSAVDTTLRRLSRDVRSAVPNSLREHTPTCVEFAPIKSAGRYRIEKDGSTGDELDFVSADTSFDVLNITPDTALAAGDQVVIYNLGQDVADLYAVINNRGAVAAGSTTALITLSPGKQFPLASPHGSFQIVPVSGPVALVCTTGTDANGNGTGTLVVRRGQGYVPATGTCPTGTTDHVLVDQVSACEFNYDPDVLKRHGLLTVSLSLSSAGETVNLVQQIHVNNVP
jgi:MSHA biogenesis protein MshO